MNGESRNPVLDIAQLRGLAPSLCSPSRTAPVAPLRRCGPPAAGHSGLRSCRSPPAYLPFATLRPSAGTGELSVIQVDGGLCRLPAYAYAGSGRLPMVIVLRRLDVGRNCQSREALPHGHSVADCPLLHTSRRLPHPGRHDGIGGTTRVDPPYSFKPPRRRPAVGSSALSNPRPARTG